jgi:hypothetical protein
VQLVPHAVRVEAAVGLRHAPVLHDPLQGRRVAVRAAPEGVTRPRLLRSLALMGIDWMTRREIVLSIPPAYTEWLGAQLIELLERAA